MEVARCLTRLSPFQVIASAFKETRDVALAHVEHFADAQLLRELFSSETSADSEPAVQQTSAEILRHIRSAIQDPARSVPLPVADVPVADLLITVHRPAQHPVAVVQKTGPPVALRLHAMPTR